ncbi:MAG: hypothetical protein ACYSUX_04170 [Planctomycetota bacterium]|jgi:hypothetical protein
MYRRLTIVSLVFSVLVVFSMVGCASTQPMALSAKTKTLDLSEASVALMTVKIANEFKPGFQPTDCFVYIKDVKTGKIQTFIVGKPNQSVKKQFNDYLVSMRCIPGEHRLQNIGGSSRHFPIYGSFQIPVSNSFDIQPGKVVYLGRIEAVNRKRVGNQPRAGSVIPLIDQGVSGFSGGTWHIKMYDNYEEDIAAFKERYPLIGNYTVEKMVLSQ